MDNDETENLGGTTEGGPYTFYDETNTGNFELITNDLQKIMK
jgi:hypothetical protein